MAKTFEIIGPVPCDEDCAQVEPSGEYYRRMQAECHSYKRQLERMFPYSAVKFVVKTFPHDAGSYSEVACVFDDNTDGWAIFGSIENNLPFFWDAEAKKELGLD